DESAVRGDEDAIALLLLAGEETATRAPATAAHWFEAALRLLPAGDGDRRATVLVSLAASLRALGELERCRAALLEALDLLPPGDEERRAGLIARCAAVEHWMGRHEDAHRRLTRAWEDVRDRSAPAAAALQLELAVDGLYTLDLDRTIAMGREALAAARATGGRALTAAAAAVLCLGEVAAGDAAAAREHRDEAVAHVDRMDDLELATRLETLFFLGWAENYLEHYEAAAARVERGLAIVRATGEGGLVVPLSLVGGYTLEMTGPAGAAVELCDGVVDAARLSAHQHELSWALMELAHAHYFAGDLERAIAAAEESAEVGGRLAGATIPASGGGPGWVLGMSLFEAGDVERSWELMHALGSDDLLHKIPVERCFDWEVLALAALARGDRAAAEGYVARSEAHAEALGLALPRALAVRSRAALLLHDGEAARAVELARESERIATGIGARLPAAFSAALAGRALAAAGDREAAIPALRHAERELDEYGSVRARDEMRRELRRFNARAEPRGPGTSQDGGVGSLTRREREIAELVTDRRTNREIAATLFLSEKTIETHLRNIFMKLGASSRVQVARILERERRRA
ncbi:MAG: LuxR C-terminal-related transcriptional regulator, partial [Solirubrobacteraceae bacterium]